jgi:predicted transcriptional regulator of viral defense system
MPSTPRDRVLALAKRNQAVRPRDLDPLGIPREYLVRLLAEGVLDRPARGFYVLADAEPDENQTLAEACKRVPLGVVCLLSALQFHGLTTQAPFEVWMAINPNARRPKVDYPPLRIVRFSATALTTGVDRRPSPGGEIRVTTPARTVVDCFAYRNKIGLDVALEALRDCRARKKATMDDLYRAAQSRRMANVMRPYLEAVA